MSPAQPLTALKTNHDHAVCIKDALDEAQALCRRKGTRFTPLRRRVLEIVWQSHKPLGAYGILDVLADEGRRPMPPTVYRALDFLQAQGLVHRIPSLNAYIGCVEPGAPHGGQYLICRACGTVAELTDSGLSARLDARARDHGFEVEAVLSEAVGLCPACKAVPGAA
ncbi:MAG: Fur family zinc uptake transcriptional regulator [Alphaproteobacteria bacterium]|jgi:Fur family zinc uptake transcriptional regulator